MALRDHGSAGPGRGARSRAGFAALACVVLIAGAGAATWPAVKQLDSAFLAGGANGNGEAAAGDHLQTGYRLWLVGHQLEYGQAPWSDPYSLRPATSGSLNPAGWPFGLAVWPLYAFLGPILAWNLFVLAMIVAAGAATLVWLRTLGLGRGAALAGGLAFALAPYRVEQSVGHLLGPISVLLPVALWAFERGSAVPRRRTWRWHGLAVAALASIPLSGQVHLALGALPFFALYAICRTRAWQPLAAAAVAVLIGAAAGLAVQRGVIAHSLESTGRSLAEVRLYSAQWRDFLARSERHGSESFVLLGWATPLIALVGLAALVRSRRIGLAVALGIGLVVPCLLALGTNFPAYEWLWHRVPPLQFPRVPERLMPIACLALAALVAVAVDQAAVWAGVAVDRLSARAAFAGERAAAWGAFVADRVAAWRRWLAPAAAALALVVLWFDLTPGIFGRSAADEGNAAYAAVRAAPLGRLTEIPVFLPDVHYGSVYMYYDMQAARERTGGYSTLATERADAQARQLEPLNCGDWTADRAGLLRRLDVSVITLHRGLFVRNTAVPDRSWYAWQGLLDHGWRPVLPRSRVPLIGKRLPAIVTFVRGSGPAPPNPIGEPARTAHFCQGWYGPGAEGVPMSRKHAPLWVYGEGALTLRLAADEPLTVSVQVDGVPRRSRRVSGTAPLGVPLVGRRWHLVAVDVDRLVQHGPRLIGARLVDLRLAGRRL